jgi:hypothetical protein
MTRLTAHRLLRIAAAAFMALLVHPIQAQSKEEKEAAIIKYKGKFLVVKKDGLFMQLVGQDLMCSNPVAHSVTNFISADQIEVIDEFHCETEPIHRGEVLKIHDVQLGKIRRSAKAAAGEEALWITVQNVSPHSITRGIGAFAHSSIERGAARIAVPLGTNGNDNALFERWFTFVDSQDSADAIKLGNTASGVFVNQVKSGMSFAEVESALGVPQTRVELGEKVLYKYKDMTVEFHDGKVTDVR